MHHKVNNRFCIKITVYSQPRKEKIQSPEGFGFLRTVLGCVTYRQENGMALILFSGGAYRQKAGKHTSSGQYVRFPDKIGRFEQKVQTALLHFPEIYVIIVK